MRSDSSCLIDRLITVECGLFSLQVDPALAPPPQGSRDVAVRVEKLERVQTVVLHLNSAITVGGQPIRYTLCKTTSHAVLGLLLPACFHMYE